MESAPLKLRGATSLGPEPAPARAAPQRVTEMLLQADVNQQRLDDSVIVLKAEDGAVLLAGEDLDRWRLRRPETAPFEHEGKLFYPVSAMRGLRVEIDEGRQTMAVVADPAAFSGTFGSVDTQRYPPPLLSQPGGFFNYQLSGTRFESTSTRNGLFEAGFFSKYGVLTTTTLAPDLDRTSSWLRLDTTYAIDSPKDMTSIRLGDTITRPGAWGRPVRIGGAQYGTNFATQPGFIRSPVLAAAGSATLPSVVDVYVNNALVQRNQVPPGPFSIQNIPVVTGTGEVQVVVRDLLGRQQVITQPFYSSATLLRGGLSDWSYEAGAIRDNYAIASNDYGDGMAAGTYRRGITDYFTGELRGETSRDIHTLGASSAVRLGNFGIVSGTFAGSQSPAGAGQLVGVGLEHLTPTLSVSGQVQLTTPGFRQIGMLENELPRQRQTFGTATYAMGAAGALSAAYVRQDFRDQPPVETATFTYSVPIVKRATFTFSVLRTYSGTPATTLFATLTIPFGELSSASLTLDRSRDPATGAANVNTTAVVQKSLPLGDGYGYRLQAHNDDYLGTLNLQNAFGTYTLEASQPKDGSTATRASISGGLGVVGGHPFLSRYITDSFGLVRVADYANVQVLQDNQVVAKTDKDGYAILPRMRAYDRNQVTINQNDLPFDATLDRLRLDAIPYYRSGVLLDFPVKRVRAGTLHVVLEDGSALPSGALARIEGQEKEFPVALQGEAYLEGFADSNRIVFTWRGQRCTLDVAYPRTSDPLPELGTFVCKGVSP